LDIAQKLGYISVIETLKVVTETVITTTHTVTIEEKYKVQAPESMQETFMSDSEDEGGEYHNRKSFFYLCFHIYIYIYIYIYIHIYCLLCPFAARFINGDSRYWKIIMSNWCYLSRFFISVVPDIAMVFVHIWTACCLT